MTHDRRTKAIRLIWFNAKRLGLSFTKAVAQELPGYPKWSGPRLTTARAEMVADRLSRRVDRSMTRIPHSLTASPDTPQPSAEAPASDPTSIPSLAGKGVADA